MGCLLEVDVEEMSEGGKRWSWGNMIGGGEVYCHSGVWHSGMGGEGREVEGLVEF